LPWQKVFLPGQWKKPVKTGKKWQKPAKTQIVIFHQMVKTAILISVNK